jgi:hypothetical protein
MQLSALWGVGCPEEKSPQLMWSMRWAWIIRQYGLFVQSSQLSAWSGAVTENKRISSGTWRASERRITPSSFPV